MLRWRSRRWRVTWVCKRFQDYVIGKTFEIHTDHKPLVSLLGPRWLHELPVWIQRFKLMRFSFTISHIPGKSLITADALSQSPTQALRMVDDQFDQKVEAYVNLLISNLPASEKGLFEIQKYQEEDVVCYQIMQYCKEGWPEKSAVKGAIKPYLPVASELSVQNGLLLHGIWIITPISL